METKYSKEQLIELWEAFGDITIDEDENIEQQFMEFEVGTNRFDIWHWFDDRYPGGIVKLMYDKD